jgi:multidrug efflux pump subunit AcrA (membrane-fusion protein)
VNTELFRAEALEHHAGGDLAEGDLVRFDRRWAGVVYKVLMAAAFVGFGFISLFSVNDYASGPAVVRIEGRRVITSAVAAAVDEVLVDPGRLVAAGTLLVRLHSADEANELARASRELDLQLARMLRDPADVSLRQSLAAFRAARDQAQNAVDARTIRAEVAGYVTDVRVRPGQHVNLGDVVLAVAPAGQARPSVVAMVPGDYRPMLKQGLPLRFELDGFRYEYADLEVGEVAAEAVGPLEVQRLLGQDRAESILLGPGAKVLVTARLPAPTFSSEGQPYGYFDGLTGTAEIRVRSEPILVTLVPALRQWIPASALSLTSIQASIKRFARRWLYRRGV